MSGRPIQKGATNVSSVVRIIDSTAGTPETGVTSATGGLAFNYRREGENAVAITALNDLANAAAAHNDGGIVHIGDGYYRIDFQDAAFASAAGEDGVLLTGTATGMIVIGTYHPLVDHDPVADVSNIYSDTTIVASDTAVVESQTTVIESNTEAIHSQTTVVESQSTVVESNTEAIHSQTTVIESDSIIVESSVQLIESESTVIQSNTEAIHSQTTVVESQSTVVESNTEAIHSQTTVVESQSTVVESNTEAIHSQTTVIEVGAATIVSGAAEAGTLSTTQMTTDLTEATDDHYIGRVVIWTSGVLANQASDITDYLGSTGMLTYTAVTEAPSAADTFIIV